MVQSKLKIKLDDNFYLTSDTYNPVILVRAAWMNDKNEDQDVFERDNRKRWYFSSFSQAIAEYVHQVYDKIGDDGQDITSFEQLAKVVDDRISHGLDVLKKNGIEVDRPYRDEDEDESGDQGIGDNESDNDE